MDTTYDYEYWVREIYFWQNKPRESFCHTLIMAYRRADLSNKMRMGIGFPMLARAMHDWEAADDNGNELFRAVLKIEPTERQEDAPKIVDKLWAFVAKDFSTLDEKLIMTTDDADYAMEFLMNSGIADENKCEIRLKLFDRWSLYGVGVPKIDPRFAVT